MPFEASVVQVTTQAKVKTQICLTAITGLAPAEAHAVCRDVKTTALRQLALVYGAVTACSASSALIRMPCRTRFPKEASSESTMCRSAAAIGCISFGVW